MNFTLCFQIFLKSGGTTSQGGYNFYEKISCQPGGILCRTQNQVCAPLSGEYKTTSLIFSNYHLSHNNNFHESGICPGLWGNCTACPGNSFMRPLHATRRVPFFRVETMRTRQCSRRIGGKNCSPGSGVIIPELSLFWNARQGHRGLIHRSFCAWTKTAVVVIIIN